MKASGSRIGVSGVFVRPSQVGGAEFLLYNLVEGLLTAGHEVALFCAGGSQFDRAFMERTASVRASGKLGIVPVGGMGNRFVRESVSLPAAARAAGVSRLIFPNYFTPPVLRVRRVVTAILDLQYLHYPANFSRVKRAWLRFAHEATLRTADQVVAISDFVRDDILDRYGAKFASKVQTIHVAVSWDRFDGAIQPACMAGRSRPFILSVASQYEHKNIATLIRAFATVRDQIEHDLVLVGQRKAALVGIRQETESDLETLVAALGLQDRVVITGHLGDPEVGWCYANAGLFVLPSLFEGFGMPAVEALGFGLPTITTRCGALPEVTRGHARHVDDPRHADELGQAICDVLADAQRWRLDPAAIDRYRRDFDPVSIAGRYAAALDA